jgi:CBS domain-containing protein
MTILRLCDQESAAVPPESTAAEAIRLMLARRVGAVVVVDAIRVVGIFTERDVLKKLALSGRDPESAAS